jgi:hypothetical protein
MKSKLKYSLLGLPWVVTLCVAALAQADNETLTGGTTQQSGGSASGDQTGSGTGEDSELQDKLDLAAAEIRDRLGMPAMLEESGDPAQEAEIAELHSSGWIVEATVDEVAAALDAAKATPTPDDDVAARILAHRASCRYFFKEESAE